MQEVRTLVPSFGNWDTGTEIPYTTVFEKVRATKDGRPLSSRGLDVSSQTPARHQFQGNSSSVYPQHEIDKYSNASSELHSGKRSVLDEWGVQNKRTADLQSSSRRSSLERIADHIFTESQHAAGNETPVISRQSTSSNASWQGNHYVNSRELREPYVKENIYMQSVPVSLPNSDNQGGLSNSHNQGILPNVHNQGYQVYGSTVVAASPRKDRFLTQDSVGSHLLYPTSGIQMYHQPFQANHPSAEMPPDRALPKFGDWDAVDPTKVEFTVIFDKARNERKVSINQEYSSKNKTDPEVDDEDLYKPTSSTQRRYGFWAWICCRSPAAVS